MRRGPRSQPTELHKLRRTFRGDRHGKRLEPLAPGELLEPPAHLTAGQRARWDQALRDAPRDVLRKVDAEALTAFVVAGDLVEAANRAQTVLDRDKQDLGKLVARGDKGVAVLSPYVKLLLRAVPLLLRAAAELGFSPAARAGMTIKEPEMLEMARWIEVMQLSERKVRADAELLDIPPTSAQPQ